MKTRFYYVPFPTTASAKNCVRKLLKERLIACGNLIGKGQSIYRWKGKTVEGSETYVLLKTSATKTKQLVRRIQEYHPYEVPCIAEIKLASINSAFECWIQKESD